MKIVQWIIKVLPRGIIQWITKLLWAQAPKLVAKMLTSIDPNDLADKIKPHLVAAMKKMPPEWQKNFVAALRILAETVAASIPEE